MTTPRSRPTLAALTLGLCLGSGGTALAQGHTPDPYNLVGEYNIQYEPYMYATVPSMPGVLPNQDRYFTSPAGRSANQFQRFLSEEDEDLFERRTSTRSAGAGTPYWQANRQYDRQFGREYRPNSGDQRFFEEKRQRTAKYFEAMRETDPRRRAQLLREYNIENLRAARQISAGRNTRREPERDRFNLEDPVAPPEESAEPTGRRPAGRNSAPPRGGGLGLPSAADDLESPSFRSGVPGRTSSPLRSPGRGTAPAFGRSTLGLSGPSSATEPSVTERLRRNALMDRARRAVAPSAPGSTVLDPSPGAPSR